MPKLLVPKPLVCKFRGPEMGRRQGAGWWPCAGRVQTIPMVMVALGLVWGGGQGWARPSDQTAGCVAQQRTDPLALFDLGCFDAAAQRAQALAGDQLEGNDRLRADHLAFAARALLSKAMVEPGHPDRLTLVETAETLAGQALDLDGTHLEGHLQRAIALGLQGRMMDPIAAHGQGLAFEARAHIDRALALRADNPYALAVAGAWHLEVVGLAGPGLGAFIYGADPSEGMARFERALAVAPRPLLFQVQYALALLAAGLEGTVGTAAQALHGVLAQPAENALERHYQALARVMVEAMANGPVTVRSALQCLEKSGPALCMPAGVDL